MKINQPVNAGTDTRMGGAKKAMKKMVKAGTKEGASETASSVGMIATATPRNGNGKGGTRVVKPTPISREEFVGNATGGAMMKTATPINGAKQTMKPYLRKAANEGRQEMASSLAGGSLNGANKAQMKQRKTLLRKGSGSTGAQPSNVRGASQTASMTPAQPVYSQTKRTGTGPSSAQPTQSGVNHFVERPTGGKAGTVGKYSSDGGRGDVGKRSYGEKTATRSTTKLDDFLKGFLYEGVVNRRNPKRK